MRPADLKIGRVWFVTLCLLLSSLGASAQNEEPQGPQGGSSFGVKAFMGWGIPSYSGLPAGASSETNTAWAFAGFYNISTGGEISFALQPELQFVSESANKVGVNDGGQLTFDVTTSLTSIRLPVLAKIQFFDRKLFQPSAYIGPSFSYLMSAKNTYNGTDTDIEGSRFGIGIAAGIDVTLLSFLVVDIRYNTKFTELTYDLTQSVQDISLTMSSFKIGVGARF